MQFSWIFHIFHDFQWSLQYSNNYSNTWRDILNCKTNINIMTIKAKNVQNHWFYILRIFSKSPHGIFSLHIILESWDGVLLGTTFCLGTYFQKLDFSSGEMC